MVTGYLNDETRQIGKLCKSHQGRIQDFQKGGAHPDTTLARKVIMYVRAPRVHVVVRAAPCREQSGDETI